MLFTMTRRLPRIYPIVALVVTNLVISMPAPPVKRSPEAADARNGFSNVPKILEIQLPLKIASKDDLVAWARYVMGLMASRINITLTTVKEVPTTTSRAPETTKNLENTKQSENIKKLEHRKQQSVNQMGGVRNLANSQNFENTRYAANVINLAKANNFEIPSNIRPVENGRRSESIRFPLQSGNFQPAREKLLIGPQLPTLTINGVTSNSLFDNRQTQSGFTNLGRFDTAIPNPLEITANINLPRSRETVFKGIFNTAKGPEPQLFVPQFPDFGPGIDPRDLPRNLTFVSTPARAYLPITTADSIKIPNDPFVTRYFFDGVERNLPRNLPVFPSNITFTTSSPSIFNDEIPLPIRNLNSLSQRNYSGIVKPLLKVPFEAVITFTRENSGETTTWRNDRDKYLLIPSRDPPDRFPPYFDTNYTLPNESGQINVVFDDGNRVTEPINDAKKEDKKKGGKKQDSSKRQQSKKQKSNKLRSSVIGQFLKTFAALRKNNSLTTDLKPPPLDSEKLTKPQQAPVVQKTSAPQKAPKGQRLPPPTRTQTYSTRKPASASGQGRRGQTSLAQQNEDDSGSNSEESNSKGSNSEGSNSEGSNSEESTEKDDDDDDNGGNGNDDVESNEGDDGSDESSSSESDYDDDSEEGEFTLVKAIADLLAIAGPILEDLSDPESDADIADVISAAIPLLEELSEGDGDRPGFDIPGISVPVFLKFSEDENGERRDSGAVLRPLIQVLAPLIGPLSGPLILPLSHQLSKPPGEGGSSIKDLVGNLLAPLLEPVGYGKMSQLSRLIAGVISGLSKHSPGGGKSDVTSLVKAVVAGSIAGTSAGSSGNKDSYGAPTGYGGGSYDRKPPTNTYAPVPPKKNHLLTIGDSIKDILNAVVKVVASLVNAITGILAASSDSSNEPAPTYGPPRPTYGAPRPLQSFAVPPSQSISITTSRPKRF